MPAATPNETRIYQLKENGLIRASGDDAATFLQGQFGNDLTKIDSAHHQLDCYSNPKGRLLAIFRAFTDGDQYFLRMPREIIAPTLARLKMFVLMAKVQLDDVSETHTGIGLSGVAASTLLAKVMGSAPEEVGEAVLANEINTLKVPGVEPRFELYGEVEKIDSIYDQLALTSELCNADQWAHEDILAGIPSIYTETREEFVAQMANLQLINGLSFKKGCFPGQEIIARMHYLGKLKRRMYLGSIDSDVPPAPGTEVFSGETNAGKIVDARRITDQPTHALMVLSIANAEAGDLHTGASDGPEVTLLPLPYSFELTT